MDIEITTIARFESYTRKYRGLYSRNLSFRAKVILWRMSHSHYSQNVLKMKRSEFLWPERKNQFDICAIYPDFLAFRLWPRIIALFGIKYTTTDWLYEKSPSLSIVFHVDLLSFLHLTGCSGTFHVRVKCHHRKVLLPARFRKKLTFISRSFSPERKKNREMFFRKGTILSADLKYFRLPLRWSRLDYSFIWIFKQCPESRGEGEDWKSDAANSIHTQNSKIRILDTSRFRVLPRD